MYEVKGIMTVETHLHLHSSSSNFLAQIYNFRIEAMIV